MYCTVQYCKQDPASQNFGGGRGAFVLVGKKQVGRGGGGNVKVDGADKVAMSTSEWSTYGSYLDRHD